jgi:F-box domain
LGFEPFKFRQRPPSRNRCKAIEDIRVLRTEILTKLLSSGLEQISIDFIQRKIQLLISGCFPKERKVAYKIHLSFAKAVLPDIGCWVINHHAPDPDYVCSLHSFDLRSISSYCNFLISMKGALIPDALGFDNVAITMSRNLWQLMMSSYSVRSHNNIISTKYDDPHKIDQVLWNSLSRETYESHLKRDSSDTVLHCFVNIFVKVNGKFVFLQKVPMPWKIFQDGIMIPSFAILHDSVAEILRKKGYLPKRKELGRFSPLFTISQVKQQDSPVFLLPPEIWGIILSYFDKNNLMALSCSCKTFSCLSRINSITPLDFGVSSTFASEFIIASVLGFPNSFFTKELCMTALSEFIYNCYPEFLSKIISELKDVLEGRIGVPKHLIEYPMDFSAINIFIEKLDKFVHLDDKTLAIKKLTFYHSFNTSIIRWDWFEVPLVLRNDEYNDHLAPN